MESQPEHESAGRYYGKPQEEEEAEAIEYSSNETAGTSLGDLLSRFKL